jgi:tetratricopeptide (TPR) repeat protein
MNILEYLNKTYEEAKDIAKNLDFPYNYLLLGSICLKYKKYKEAYQYLSKIKEEYPKLFAYSAFAIGKFEDCIKYLHKSSLSIDEYIMLVIAYLYLDNLDQARFYLRKALSTDKKKTVSRLRTFVEGLKQNNSVKQIKKILDLLES